MRSRLHQSRAVACRQEASDISGSHGEPLLASRGLSPGQANISCLAKDAQRGYQGRAFARLDYHSTTLTGPSDSS